VLHLGDPGSRIFGKGGYFRVLISGMELCSSMQSMLRSGGKIIEIFSYHAHLSCYTVLAEVLNCFTVNLSISIINAVMSPLLFDR